MEVFSYYIDGSVAMSIYIIATFLFVRKTVSEKKKVAKICYI